MANYYDIDDILAEEELVSVVFQKQVNGVGIDPSAEADIVESGSKVEIPFWLAHELHLRQVVAMSVPACFNQKMMALYDSFKWYKKQKHYRLSKCQKFFTKRTRLEIQADVAFVDLRSRCQYFYEFGCKVAPLVGDRSIGPWLLSTFRSRYKEVLTKAHSASFAATSKFLTLLSQEETNLYEAAQSSMTAVKKWRIGGPRFQRASFLRKKRKPIE